MGDMPYSIDKGQALTFVDDTLNRAPESELVKFVRTWRQNPQPKDLITVFSEELVHPGEVYTPDGDPGRAAMEAKYPAWYAENYWHNAPASIDLHLTNHWFSPGFFLGLEGGLVEEIVGETVCRSVEASLGVDITGLPGDPAPASSRRWPIDLWWACPAPRFDGHVSWQEIGTSGHVRVLFLTPGTLGGALFSPLTTDPTLVDPTDATYGHYHLEVDEARTYAAGPTMATPPTYDAIPHDGRFSCHESGSWIVSAQSTEIVWPDDDKIPGFRTRPPFDVKVEKDPLPIILQTGPVEVVSPAFASGGVRPH